MWNLPGAAGSLRIRGPACGGCQAGLVSLSLPLSQAWGGRGPAWNWVGAAVPRVLAGPKAEPRPLQNTPTPHPAPTLHSGASLITLLLLEGPQISWRRPCLQMPPLSPLILLPSQVLPRSPHSRSSPVQGVVFMSSGPPHDWPSAQHTRECRARLSCFRLPGCRQMNHMWEVPTGVQPSPGHCCSSLGLILGRQVPQ